MNRFSRIFLLIAILVSSAALGQLLPPHPPLRILIVSDQVNPHGLPPEDLTQPGEISAALLATPALNLDSGIDAVIEIGTDEIEMATGRLAAPPGSPSGYDVLIYFAHRIPNGGTDPQGRQEAFVTAAEAFLAAGGGVLSFHHGIYRTNGKQSMQSVLGGEATGGVPWNTVDGQNVIAVAPDHFIARHAVAYPSATTYADPAHGIDSDTFGFFNNTPDERYPTLTLLPDADDVEILFASDYADNGSTHLLGWTHKRPRWNGVVVVYQPGEHQPLALGAGNNYQILLNAVVYAATFSTGELIFGDGFEGGDSSLWSTTP